MEEVSTMRRLVLMSSRSDGFGSRCDAVRADGQTQV